VATWLMGLLGAWLFVRHRNFWGVFILGGAGLFSNLTYLPPNAGVFLGLWLFTGLMAVARVQAIRRKEDWGRHDIKSDGHLWALSLTDSFLISAVVLTVAFLIPDGHKISGFDRAYDSLRSPVASWEGDFNRLFAGLPARRPLGYRIWGDVMPFQGTISPTATQVLQVDSPQPMYWKARTYGTYTSQGWVSEDTTLKPLGWVPTYTRRQNVLERVEVDYSITTKYASNTLFVGEQISGTDYNARIETYDSPSYVLDLTDRGTFGTLPPRVADAAAAIRSTVESFGAAAADRALAKSLPNDFLLVDVARDGGTPVRVTIAEVLPDQPDVLSLRSADGALDSGDTYRMTSYMSTASPAQLRQAGSDYPTWAIAKYTQLPENLPARVPALGQRLTAGANNAYDKARAIDAFLEGFPYTLEMTRPAFDADGVDHFLFTAGAGYSEYFASAMAVLLRSVGVPARLATGYTSGDKLAERDTYLVKDSHGHAWVEVYFPNYGWIVFEPTPGKFAPQIIILAVADGEPIGTSNSAPVDERERCVGLLEECEDLELLGSLDEGEGFSALWRGTVGSAFFWTLLMTGVAGVVMIGGLIFWRRAMEPTPDPGKTYRRLARLGALGSSGPDPYQTPYQYRERLAGVLPQYREELSEIVGSYVRSLYGKKTLTGDQEERLMAAWSRLRLPMLLRIIRRRRS